MQHFEHITFITGNASKAKEVAALMPGINILDIDLVEIQEIDSAKIIAAKLKSAVEQVQGPIVVDDTSLYFDSLGGRLPGPFVKWFAHELTNAGLADLALRLGNNKAKAKTMIGYAQDAESPMLFFEGSLEGTIVPPREHAAHGHGWDAIFKPQGATVTFADMDLAEKNAISPRAQAINKLRAYLENVA